MGIKIEIPEWACPVSWGNHTWYYYDRSTGKHLVLKCLEPLDVRLQENWGQNQMGYQYWPTKGSKGFFVRIITMQMDWAKGKVTEAFLRGLWCSSCRSQVGKSTRNLWLLWLLMFSLLKSIRIWFPDMSRNPMFDHFLLYIQLMSDMDFLRIFPSFPGLARTSLAARSGTSPAVPSSMSMRSIPSWISLKKAPWAQILRSQSQANFLRFGLHGSPWFIPSGIQKAIEYGHWWLRVHLTLDWGLLLSETAIEIVDLPIKHGDFP